MGGVDMKAAQRLRQALLCLMGLMAFSQADELHFRTVMSRNDAVVGGEFRLQVQVRIAAGQSPRTLGGLTCDVLYGAELQAVPDEAAVGWAFGSPQGYRTCVSKRPGLYRVLVIDDGVNSEDALTPPGIPAGWNVTSDWQTIVTLRWLIAANTQAVVQIENRTDAASFTENISDAPHADLQDWEIVSFSLGSIDLPVELTLFSAERLKGMVTLRWTTQSESHNLGFQVYRSLAESGPYLMLSRGIIAGAGESVEPHDYMFVDPAAAAGTTYFYKLADVDRDGTQRFHGPVCVNSQGPDAYALEQNYPNPFNAETQIHFTLKASGFCRMQVLNVTGQNVRALLSRDMNAGHHFVVWNGRDDQGILMPSGIYMLYLHVNDFSEIRKMHFIR
jgi:hypothetical protein